MDASDNLLALDVGEVRIGLARASSIAKIPEPLGAWTNDADFPSKLNDLLRQQNIAILIVGLPRGLAGQETQQTEAVRQFADSLNLTQNVKLYFQDEAVTSVLAEENLKNRQKNYSKADVDSEAACLILQDFITNQMS